jgi:flagellum-specific ATP synthase
MYTVLVEGDDLNEPVADAARGILDGHIWLSRKLAARSQYPAVSVLDSISRVMQDVADAEQIAAAQKVRRLMAVWSEIEDLVNIGAYANGTNAEFDLAIRMRPAIEALLKQGIDEESNFAASREGLLKLSALIDQTQAAIAQKVGTVAPTSAPRQAARPRR